MTKLTVQKWLWLIGLTLLFFSSYNFANWFTSTRVQVNSVVYAWEQAIPLLPWTIVPYWSIDLMYGLAILLAKSSQSLKILGLRLLSAQIICVVCFLVFPLKFSFERPPLDGFFGLLFDILMGFDKPFNQVPSLHITLLVILWQFYASYYQTVLVRYLLHLWCLCIALSVLTTWQHHFFDVPTGLWVGCFCIWLWPQSGESILKARPLSRQYRWGVIYFILSLLSFSLAIYVGGWGLWLLWLSASLLLVAVNYVILGAEGFQKQLNGQFNLAVALLYLPYFSIMWLNSRLWTIKHQDVDRITDNIYLGRIPSGHFLNKYQFLAVIDLCAELPIGHFDGSYSLIPVLDMTPLSEQQCQYSAQRIEQYHRQGKLLVCCALGYSRSATAVIAWLLWTKKALTVEDAITQVKTCRTTIVISDRQRLILTNWLAQLTNRESIC